MGNGRIAALMPSRNKPDLALHAATLLRNTSTLADLFIYVAEDDPKLAGYYELAMQIPWAVVHFGEPLGFSRGVNYLYSRHTDYTAYLRMEDDFECQIEGWDKQYLDAMPKDEIGMVWCNYVHKGPDAEPQTAAVGGRWIDALGYFSLPGILHFYCDNALGDLGKAIERAYYLPEPLIRHNWNPNDPRKCGHPIDDSDSRTYFAWRNGQRFLDDVEKLKRAMRNQ